MRESEKSRKSTPLGNQCSVVIYVALLFEQRRGVDDDLIDPSKEVLFSC